MIRKNVCLVFGRDPRICAPCVEYTPLFLRLAIFVNRSTYVDLANIIHIVKIFELNLGPSLIIIG
jgi:hypothetical protein